jgi:hypothetical protein
MSTPSLPRIEHADVWDLLPWLVNGRLDDPERIRVEAHLAHCTACRDEYASQRRLYEVLAVDAPFEQLPTAGLKKLHRRLTLEAGHAVRTIGPTRQDRLPRAGRRRMGHIALGFRSIAASVIAIGVVGLLGVRDWHSGPPPSYFTLTSPAPQYPDAVIRAVFSPTITVKQRELLLDAAHLRIVSGPSEAGVYSLAMNGSTSMAWSLRYLRAQDGVRFAEAIAPPPAERAPP